MSLPAFIGLAPFAMAYDINEKLSVGGVAAGVYQYQDLSANKCGVLSMSYFPNNPFIPSPIPLIKSTVPLPTLSIAVPTCLI